MALWLVRAGKFGEHEEKFFQTNRIYLTWTEIDERDLTKIDDHVLLKQIVSELAPQYSSVQLSNAAGQFKAFLHTMKIGDLIAVPRKHRSTIAFGKITSVAVFDQSAEPVYRHYRDVQWLNIDVPRSNIDQDLLYSFGSLLTISQPRAADAEQRIRALIANGPKPNGDRDPIVDPIDLEEFGRDAIADLIIRRFKGKRMELLVAAVLRAQGYTTYVSPEGADKGVDILAAPGALGFGHPRICVQVKSSTNPTDSPTLNQLLGTMQNVKADQGLLVSWGGFKQSVEKERPNQFFQIRLWGKDELIDQILEHYHHLDEDIRTELPLKRIWTVAIGEDEL